MVQRKYRQASRPQTLLVEHMHVSKAHAKAHQRTALAQYSVRALVACMRARAPTNDHQVNKQRHDMLNCNPD